MSVDQKIVERIQALLNKTTDRGCTEAEAQAAMEAAMRIANKHNLDLASVVATGDEAKGSKLETDRANLTDERCKKRRPHHDPIANVLQSCFDVTFIWLGGFTNPFGVKVAIIGEKTDVAIATYCWQWLCQTFPKLYLAYVKEQGIIRTPADNDICRRSYFEGLAAGINSANRRQREEVKASAQGESFALVLVKKEEVVQARVAEEFPKLKTRVNRERSTDYGAWSKGLEKGQTIKLNAGLTGGTNPESLL